VPYFFDYDFYAAVAATLLAGDIQARVVTNPEAAAIEVQLVDGSRVLWSNARGLVWGYSIIREHADMEGDTTRHPWDLEAAEAAKVIATFDYPVPVAFPAEHPGDDD
jgi:hypothetical protein